MISRLFRMQHGLLLPVLAVALLLVTGCAATAPRKPADTGNAEPDSTVASDYYLEAKMAEAKQNWPGAITAYLEALQYAPDSDEIAAALARVFIRDDKIRSALIYARRAVELDPKKADNWQLVQLLEQQEGQFDLAAQALRKYMALTPDYIFSHDIKLAQYYYALERRNDAVKHLISRAKDPRMASEDIIEIANLLAFNGDLKEAGTVLDILIKRDPLDVMAWLSLAELRSAEGRTEEAATIYRQALEKNPDNLFIVISIGNQCLEENDWDCAISSFEQAIASGREKVEEIGIRYTEIQKTLTTVYFYAGRDRDAMALFQTLKSAGADDAGLYFSLGKAMNYLERYADAAGYYRTGLDKITEETAEETLLRAYAGYARSLVNTDRMDDALAMVQNEATKHIEDTAQVKELEAGIYMEMKRYPDAIALYEWLTASDPENRNYRYSLSVAYDLNHQFESAERLLLEMLKEEPDDPLVLNNLAYLYLENSDQYKKALTLVKQALIAEPNNGAYLDTLAWAYYRLGNYRQALKYIEQAIRWAESADSGVIHEHHGDILSALGKRAEARDAWKKAIENGEDAARLQPKIDGVTP